jgi:hypothetical protein
MLWSKGEKSPPGHSQENEKRKRTKEQNPIPSQCLRSQGQWVRRKEPQTDLRPSFGQINAYSLLEFNSRQPNMYIYTTLSITLAYHKKLFIFAV